MSQQPRKSQQNTEPSTPYQVNGSEMDPEQYWDEQREAEANGKAASAYISKLAKERKLEEESKSNSNPQDEEARQRMSGHLLAQLSLGGTELPPMPQKGS